MPGQQSFLFSVLSRDFSLMHASILDPTTPSKVWATGYKYVMVAGCGTKGEWILACDASDHLHIYDAFSGKLAHSLSLGRRPNSISGSRLSPSGLIRFEDGTMAVLDALSGSIRRFQVYPDEEESHFVLGCCFGGVNESLAIQGNECEYLIIYTPLSWPPSLAAS